jgi:hypothetical protein
MSKAIQEGTVRLLFASGALKNGDVTIVPATDTKGKRWEVLLKVGKDDFTVASAREKVRRWASLDSVIQWLKDFGLGEVLVKTITAAEAEAINDKK